MKIAIEVTEHNRHFISMLNGGVTPEVEYPTAYFVFHTDETVPNEIVAVEDLSGSFKMCKGFMIRVD